TAAACKKDNIKLYKGDSYIQFSKNYVDSSLFSFLALPDKDQALTPMPVELVGNPVDKDRTYKIQVVKELTTASAANYSIPDSFTLKAGHIIDTAWITVKKTPDIAVKPVRLVLQIASSNDLKTGQSDYAVSILYISNVIAKPDWWDEDVIDSYLGDYSDKKYKLFIQVTGLSDLDPNNPGQLEYYTILFKNYLLREKDAGRTVYEDNGTEMTVALIGG
ncbi:MAG: DUF4843 domain-containing protein, partial [Chitinophaga rupis]